MVIEISNVVGQWELEVTSDSGSRKQLLRINPYLSAVYGPIAIDILKTLCGLHGAIVPTVLGMRESPPS